MRIGIIGGTGMCSIGDADTQCSEAIATPFGDVTVVRQELDEREIVFVPRHGPEHSVPPHRVNYRANIAALHKLGVRNVLATAAVGAIARRLRPGELVLPTQFLDFTRQRPLTFWDGQDGQVVHVDLTEPYCPRIHDILASAATRLGIDFVEQATYVCAEGPRFESGAEIRMYGQLGGDIIGMTAIPELVLAREASMCYAAVCIATNPAAGIAGQRVAHDDVERTMDQARPQVLRLLAEAVRAMDEDADCPCRTAAPPLSFG